MALALKERNPDIRIALADPMGSALYNYYANGELKAEGNSITEGIGQGRDHRPTSKARRSTTAFQITDEEALPLVFDLIEERRAVPGRLERHQRHGGHEARARTSARARRW